MVSSTFLMLNCRHSGLAYVLLKSTVLCLVLFYLVVHWAEVELQPLSSVQLGSLFTSISWGAGNPPCTWVVWGRGERVPESRLL